MTISIENVKLKNFADYYGDNAENLGSKHLTPRTALHLYDTAISMVEDWRKYGYKESQIFSYLPKNCRTKPESFFNSIAEKIGELAENIKNGDGIILKSTADEVALVILYKEALSIVNEYGNLENTLSYYDNVPKSSSRDTYFYGLLKRYLKSIDYEKVKGSSFTVGKAPELWFMPYNY